MAAASSSSTSLPRWEYDVFLSFRGEDTRKSFVGHLYAALVQKGIRTFKDDEKLERGKSISEELVKHINESRIAVIVFSENYASSSWCLDELVEILKCSKTKGQTVLPLFYSVKASEVRQQKRKYEEAFRQHEETHKEMERVQRWRDALKAAANLSGFDLEDAANGYEDKFIQQIVQEISKNLPRAFKVAEYEVGIDSRVEKLIMLLNSKMSEDNILVGICGFGGIGKTTLAKAVFNRKFYEFEGSCFLENVREESIKHDGLAKLQEKLLRQTLKDNNIQIWNSGRGITEIKDRLQHKKVLIVLDDVNHEKQLMSLVGIEHNWFGLGSIIIITTRDERLLTKYKAKIYKAELLDDNEALELFSWHAFKQKNSVEEYQELSCRIKYYVKGLPLALQVLGSFLCGRSIQEWKSELDKLKSNPPKEIQDILRISVDGLDKTEKDIFLDIACFFKGCEVKFATAIFHSCEFHPIVGIQVLIERSLITKSENNKLCMHDLIQEMGQEIVRQESEDPGRRSRLWSYEDIYEVLSENTVTESIEAIMLPERGSSPGGYDLHVSVEAFTKMRKLRILKISGVQLLGHLTYLSNKLSYLDWNGYPGEHLPSKFHPKKLAVLQLSHSPFKGIWTNRKFPEMLKVLKLEYCEYLPEKTINFSGFPVLEELHLIGCTSLVEVEFDDDMKSLKVINLSWCENLKKTPNLSVLPCLEILNFSSCTSLTEVHPSIEFHERLVELDFCWCKKLKSIAKRIHLKSLKLINLRWCSKLEEFPEIQGDMECLHGLDLSHTAIIELSPSVTKHLKGLQVLGMGKCKMLERLGDSIPQSVEYLKGLGILPSNIGEMKSLAEVSLSGSGIKKLPSSFAQLTHLEYLWCDDCNLDEESILNLPHSLVELDLGRNKFASLPASFTQLTNLEYLNLDGCLSLQTLDSLPSSILTVSACGCSSLERYSIPKRGEFISRRREFIFAECHKLVVNDGNKKPNIYNSESELQEIEEIIVPGSEIPGWFSHTYESSSEEGMPITPVVCLRMDPNSFHYLKGVYVCAVFGSNQRGLFSTTISLVINGKSEKVLVREWVSRIRSDHMMLFYISDVKLFEDGKCNYIQASIDRPRKVKKWGIHPKMNDEDEDEEDEDEDEDEDNDEDGEEEDEED